MTDDPTERAARATIAAKLSTASKDRNSKTDSPGVAQPATAGSAGRETDEVSDRSDLDRDPDAQEKAHLGSGTAR